MSSQEIADEVRKWQGGWEAANEIERLSAALEALIEEDIELRRRNDSMGR